MSTVAIQSIPQAHNLHQSSKKMSFKTASAPTSSDGSGVVKPKQSKSRNGCVTCKAKRLKCDETKPGCQQCAKRGVSCGGYKKDFKWRAFAEPITAVPKATKKSKGSPGLAPPSKSYHHDLSGPSSPALSDLSMMSDPSPLPPLDDQFSSSEHSGSYFAPGYPAPYDTQAPVHQHMFETDQFSQSRSDESYLMQSYTPHAPRLQDLLSPGSHLNRQSPIPDFMNFPFGPEELGRQRHHHDEHMDAASSPQESQHLKVEDDVEEIIRATENSDWELGTSLPYPQSSMENPWGMGAPAQGASLADVFRRPSASAGNNQELWLSYFDKQTCGIMSIKDGRTENPWRTLIW